MSATHSEGPTVVAHSRQYSVLSTATTAIATAAHIQRTDSPDITYCDAMSHQSTDSDRLLALPQWSTLGERKRSNYSSEKRSVRSSTKSYLAPLPILRYVKLALELFMTLWAGYSTGRYLWAFTIYASLLGQLASIGLGICAGLGFALSTCSGILSLLQPRLLAHGISVKILLSLRTSLRYLASSCLAIPAVINLVLVFVWKSNQDRELQFKDRCSLDVDLVWSTSAQLCNKNRSWSPWIITAALRLFVTFAFIITFHIIAALPQFALVRRQSKVRFIGSKKSHSRIPSTPGGGANRRSTAMRNGGLDDRHAPRPTTHPTVHASDTSFSSKASPRNRHRTHTSSSGGSQAPSYNNPNFIPPNSPGSADRDFGGFVDRFRALISQITRETEDGLAFARSDSGTESCRSRKSTINSGIERKTSDGSASSGAERLPRFDEEDEDDDDTRTRVDDVEAPGYYAAYGYAPNYDRGEGYHGDYTPTGQNNAAPTTPSRPQRHAYGPEFHQSPHSSPNSDSEDEDEEFYLRGGSARNTDRVHTVDIGDYHNSGSYYPADEHVRMMNGYIRRMPTIESMGSKELRSSLGASSAGRGGGRSPTPNGTGGTFGNANGGGTGGKSRPNSLSAQAEILVGLNGLGVGPGANNGSPSKAQTKSSVSTSEVGELMSIRCVPPPSAGNQDDGPVLPAFLTSSPAHSPPIPFGLPPHSTTTASPSPLRVSTTAMITPTSSSSSSLLQPSQSQLLQPHPTIIPPSSSDTLLVPPSPSRGAYASSTTSSAKSANSAHSATSTTSAASFHTASSGTSETGSTVDSLRRALNEAMQGGLDADIGEEDLALGGGAGGAPGPKVTLRSSVDGFGFPLPPGEQEFKPSPRLAVKEL